MRERLWKLFYETKQKCFYFERYMTLLKTIDNGLTFLCTIASLSYIAAWGVFQTFPWAFSILVGIAQLIQATRPFLLWSHQLAGLKHAVPDIKKLLLDLEIDWIEGESVRDFSEEEYHQLYKKFNIQYQSIVEKFLCNEHIYAFAWIERKAAADVKTHMINHHQLQDWSDTDAQQTTASSKES